MSSKIEGEIKSFQDKQELKESVFTKPALQEILKAKREHKSNIDQKGTETTHRNSDFTGNTMALNSYLSIVTLNVHGLSGGT